MVALGGFNESSLGYLRWEGFGLFLYPPYHIMSLSDQHPYTLFVAGGLRSPSLAKARVEVGNNANAYLASTDIVIFLGQTQPSPPIAGHQVNSRDGVHEE